MPIFTPELIARYAQQAAASAPPPAPSPQDDQRRQFHQIGLPAMLGGNIADLGTTLQAIHAGRATEANPLMGHGGTAGMVAMKAGTTAAEAFLLEKLAKDHPKAAFVSALTLGAIGGALAVHNATVGK